MTKPKTLDQLQAEKERAETQLAQEQHKLERLENRKKYLEKGERTKRTHRLCNLGGTVESLAPEIKDLTRTEMTELIEQTAKTIKLVEAIVLAVLFSSIAAGLGGMYLSLTLGIVMFILAGIALIGFMAVRVWRWWMHG